MKNRGSSPSTSRGSRCLAARSGLTSAKEAPRRSARDGLGSENNVKLAEQGKKPFFNWIDCDDVIATARGGGGGLALWTRTEQPGCLEFAMVGYLA